MLKYNGRINGGWSANFACCRHTFRFNPALIEEGKNPFTLDSKEASYEYRDFIMNEVLGKLLGKKVPVKEQKSCSPKRKKQAKDKYEHLSKYGKLFA